MRMRYKPYARPELAAWPYYVDEPSAHTGVWRNIFTCPHKPLRLELGCGKGRFLAQLSLEQPNFNYLGIDIKSEMLVVAKRTIECLYTKKNRTLGNVLITACNIERIGSMLAFSDNVQRLYINFCNPWCKSGHAKHRLTHPRQLANYRDFLASDAEIWFKTDDWPLFRDSLRYFAYTGFEVVWKTDSLHRQEPVWNIRTEHEAMFAAEGKAIYACIAVMRPAPQLDREALRTLKNI